MSISIVEVITFKFPDFSYSTLFEFLYNIFARNSAYLFLLKISISILNLTEMNYSAICQYIDSVFLKHLSYV